MNKQFSSNSSEQSSINMLDKIRNHPLSSKLKNLFVGGAFVAGAAQLNAQDISNTIQVDSNYLMDNRGKSGPSELLQKIHANQELIHNMKCHLDDVGYEGDTTAIATQIVESIGIDTRSMHNIHISFRLPADVNLGTTYMSTLINNINNILTNTYNPLPGEDYYISGYDIKKLPPSYYVSRWGNVDLTLAGNPTSGSMLNSVTIVKGDAEETCLVVVVVPLSAGSGYTAGLANRIGENVLNTEGAVTVMKSGSNSEILLSAWTWMHEVLGHLAGFYYPGGPDDGGHSNQSCNGNNDYMNPSTGNQICSTSQDNIAADTGPVGGGDVEECTIYPLPLQLLSFGGESMDESTNRLTWKVAQEKDIDGYAIEYSIDGKSWAEAGYVSAKNNLQQTNYTYDHVNAPMSTYYRIKSINLDGEYTYQGKIIHISKKGEQSFLAYPNPTNGSINIELKGSDGIINNIEIYNMLGQKVSNKQLTGSSEEIDLQDLPDGVYNIQATTSDGNKHNQKIVKQ